MEENKTNQHGFQKIGFFSVCGIAALSLIVCILMGINNANTTKSLREEQDRNSQLNSDKASLQNDLTNQQNANTQLTKDKQELEEELANIVEAKNLEDCTWAEIAEISVSGKASQVFKIGDTKKVKLKHQNGETVCQSVRIIGFNYDELSDDTSKKAGITFEFCDLISDSRGNSLAAQFNAIPQTYGEGDGEFNVYDMYSKSNIRYMLDKGCGELSEEDGYSINWLKYLDELPEDDTKFLVSNSEPEHCSVFEMLPSDLQAVIKTVNKDSLEYNYESLEEDECLKYSKTVIKAKLFLLSRDEITTNRVTSDSYHILGTGKNAYEFYDRGHIDTFDTVEWSYNRQTALDDCYRIKSGLHYNDALCWYDEDWNQHNSFKVFGQEGDEIYNYAGLSSNSPDWIVPNIGSGPYWTRTPLNTSDSWSDLWAVNQSGTLVTSFDYNGVTSAIGVAPAFCI